MRPRKVSDGPGKKETQSSEEELQSKKRKRSTNMDNHWCSFSSLESAESMEGTDNRHNVALLLLDRLVFVKY